MENKVENYLLSMGLQHSLNVINSVILAIKKCRGHRKAYISSTVLEICDFIQQANISKLSQCDVEWISIRDMERMILRRADISIHTIPIESELDSSPELYVILEGGEGDTWDSLWHKKQKLEKKLSPKFIENAPGEVVKMEKMKLNSVKSAMERLIFT